MKIKNFKIRPIGFICLLVMVTLFCPPGPVEGSTVITTHKDIYKYGEMIKVNFFGSPGNDGDWICIVPVGSPDTEGGNYKYIPKGSSGGFLIFEPPSPGKYEARAYYNYSRSGYVVSGRHAFSVISNPEGEAAMAERMERKIDPGNPVEAGLAPGHGLVYIFREALFASSGFEVQMMANGNPIVLMLNSSYFPLEVPAGNVKFTPGFIGVPNSKEKIASGRECEATINVKPGHVYYLRLKMIPMPVWVLFLDHVAHEEGANIIQSYKLTQIKK